MPVTRCKPVAIAAALVLAGFLAACEEEAEGLPPVGEDRVAADELACIADGGRWRRGGKAQTLVCYIETSDGGNACSKEGDCEGFCLARSRTCAPVTPLFGCNEVLGASGARSTICVD